MNHASDNAKSTDPILLALARVQPIARVRHLDRVLARRIGDLKDFLGQQISALFLQAALAREVYYLVAEGVVSAADVDTALCWGPGLRWGIMGNMLLNHLGGGQGGIEHFFQQFTGPMTAWWKVLGSPQLTPEVQKKLIDSVHAEVGSRSVDELAAERDELLLGLLELRTKPANATAGKRAAALAS